VPNITNIRASREVPATVQELMAQRYRPRAPTLNQEVEAIFIKLWEDESFRALMSAVTNEESVEGLCRDDDVMASLLVRDFAKAHDIETVQGRKLSVIAASLRLVADRYGLSRRKRRISFGDDLLGYSEPMPDADAAA
jgi:hypothetical protein